MESEIHPRPSIEREEVDLEKQPTPHPAPPPTEPEDGFQYIEWTTPLPESLLSSVPTNPFDWSASQKTRGLALCCFSTFVAAFASGAYTSGIPQMSAEWNIGKVPLLVGLTTFTTGFATAPMVNAPISEVYGRIPVFYGSHVLFNLTHLGCALCQSFPGMLAARAFQGIAASTFSSICGGVISDLYHTENRGFPMALFSTVALFATGLGPVVGGLIVGAGLTWRWIHWLQLIVNGAALVIVVLAMKETRGSVLLHRRAIALNTHLDAASPGVGARYKARVDEQRQNLNVLLKVSLTRPFVMLVTEPVVFFFSLWTAFAWGILYLFLQGVPIVYTQSHGFNDTQLGLVFLSMTLATLVALALNSLLEALTPYLRPSPAPEARLYSSCTFGPLLPIALFWFGFTSTPTMSPVLPALAVAVATIAIFTIYLAVFNYFCDCYHRYASSALAAQSFLRNIFAGIFPALVPAMYAAMGVRGMGCLLGGVAAVLGVVPWVLVVAGERIRGKSKWLGKTDE